VSSIHFRLGGCVLSKKYDTFAAYLEDVYYNQIFSKIKSYLYNNQGRLDLSTSAVPDPSYVELSDFKIMGVNFHESDTDKIECKVTVRAEIEISGRGRRDYESDLTECWLSIPFAATLKNGLQQVRIGYASEYSRELFRAEDALTKYLVPYIYAKDLDKHAERFLEKYCPRALEEPMPLPIKEIVENMGLTVYHAPLPDGIFGRTYFNDANVEVFTNKTCSETEDRTICPGTILVNPDVVFMRNIGSTNNTVIHECVHWDKHYKFFELQKLLNPDIQAISCAVVEDYKKKSNELEDELSWMEWQANALAPKILIPAKTGKAKLSEILNRLHRAYRGRLRDGYVMELAISEFADFFKVSTTAAKIRAVELGFEQAAGVFNFVDGKNYPPFSFKKGSLKKGQTFVIDRNNIIIESLFNPDLAEDFKAGRFIHAGGLFVINDPKYVNIVEDTEPTLTDYALEHVDECCLVFDRTTRVSSHYDDSFYRICFLCRDADSKSFVEAKFNPKEGKNEDVQKRAREMAAIAAEAKRVSDILAEVPSSFCGTLDYHIKRRGYTNEKMEERTGISSRMIQDYRNKKDAKPTLQSVLALCIGLNLHPSFSYVLIVVGQALCGIFSLYTKRSLQLEFAQAVCIGTFGSIVASFILVALGEPCGWRAVNPAF
jgi:transcriptional regulator with XRE-family HTH domain